MPTIHPMGRRSLVVLLLTGSSLAVVPLDAHAHRQQGIVSRISTPDAGTRGWIGITYEGNDAGLPTFQTVQGRRGFTVKEVVPGSPAVAAGLRDGDLIVSVNGGSVEPENFHDLLQVRVGERVDLRVLRGGRLLNPTLVAGPLPAGLRTSRGPLRESRVDSVRVRIFQEMDSLLTLEGRLGESRSILALYRSGAPDATPRVQGGGTVAMAGRSTPSSAPGWALRGASSGRTVTVLSPDMLRELSVRAAAEASEARFPGMPPGGSLPFDVFVFRSHEGDSLVVPHPESRWVTRVQGAQEAARQEPQGYRASLPVSPYVLGQRMVAGAEVANLNPQLSEYFQGEQGLLVLQVIPGSPAAEAGMIPGDIITRMGDRRVQTVDEARTALERTTRGAIPVTLVRRGRSLLVSLPR